MKTKGLKYRFEIGMAAALLLAACTGTGWAQSSQRHQVLGVTGPSFTFTAKDGHISTSDGNSIYMWGYANGSGPGAIMQYPGPTMIVNEGDLVTVTLFMPQEYVGTVMTLCNNKRGVQLDMTYHGRQVHLHYEIPLAEIVLDFFDKLKSVSRGYASMDYEFKEYRAADVVKVDLLINSDKVDALSTICHRSNARYRAREVVSRMRELIPRQMYDVAIQAAIGAEIIARENVKALRKNVLAKCYGGDISRKKKLLEKQKAGKKRMKQVGSVEIPQEAFLAILQVDDK